MTYDGNHSRIVAGAEKVVGQDYLAPSDFGRFCIPDDLI
jgi:hypothetical protein